MARRLPSGCCSVTATRQPACPAHQAIRLSIEENNERERLQEFADRELNQSASESIKFNVLQVRHCQGCFR